MPVFVTGIHYYDDIQIFQSVEKSQKRVKSSQLNGAQHYLFALLYFVYLFIS